MAAHLHYPLQPKSDLTFFYALANLLIQNGWIDREYIAAHTTGFDEFAAQVAAFDLDRAVQASGIARERIEELARLIHEGKRVSFWWTMGVNQSHEGTRTAQALIALALMTANIGGRAPAPTRSPASATRWGSRAFSNTTKSVRRARLHERSTTARSVGDPRDRHERIPSEPSLAYDQILDGICRARSRACG